jgi:hypothetical protein
MLLVEALFLMDTSMLATSTGIKIYPSQSAMTTATCLRVAAMSIAAYEYVAHFISPALIMTHIRSAIS